MDVNALVRIICLALASYGFQVGSTPPNPPASAEEQEKYREGEKKRDKVLFSVSTTTMALRAAFHSWTAVEFLAFGAREFSLASLASSLQLGEPVISAWLRSLAQTQLYMSPQTAVGFGLACAGTWLRLASFRRLAKQFKFELSLQENHKLITDGPYALVRHPSYTGALMAIYGVVLLQLGRGSLWYQRGLPGKFKWFGLAYVLFISLFALPMLPRAKVEDEVLSAHFGEEWQRWARKTRYRILPGIW